MVSSFLPVALEEAISADPAVPRALIVADGTHEVVARAADYGCTFLHPRQDLVDERLVNEAHRAGMSVNAWTIDSRREAAALDALGVDGVIADRWGVLPTP
jgi:glycerophosphoryl diester phosphodiesterase